VRRIGREHVLDLERLSGGCLGAGALEEVFGLEDRGRRGAGHDDGGCDSGVPADNGLGIDARPGTALSPVTEPAVVVVVATVVVVVPLAAAVVVVVVVLGDLPVKRKAPVVITTTATTTTMAPRRRFLRRFSKRCICSILARRAAF